MQDFRDFDVRRRDLMVGAAATAAMATVPSVAGAQTAAGVPGLKVSFTVNGKAHDLELDCARACISPAPRRAATTASVVPAR